jgi:hypothetical protein
VIAREIGGGEGGNSDEARSWAVTLWGQLFASDRFRSAPPAARLSIAVERGSKTIPTRRRDSLARSGRCSRSSGTWRWCADAGDSRAGSRWPHLRRRPRLLSPANRRSRPANDPTCRTDPAANGGLTCGLGR